MSFLSKAWKSIKGAVKSIGKGLKKAAQSVGKFMDKVGIVGQIAMAFVLPYIGSALGGMLSGGVGSMAASSNALISGAGKVLQTAGKFASTAGNVYKTVTDGVMSFVKNVGGSVVNQTASLLGKNTALMTNAPGTVTEGFKKWMTGVGHDVQNIPSPFRKVATDVTSQVVDTPYQKSIDRVFDRDFTAPTLGPSPNANFNIEPSNELFKSGLDPKVVKDLMGKEYAAEKSLLSKVTDYTLKTTGKVVDQVTGSFASSVGQGMATKLGIAPENKTEVTNISNAIPQFNSKPINNMYEANGFSYGATPNNRVQYFAASNQPFGDFGRSGFAQFNPVRTF